MNKHEDPKGKHSSNRYMKIAIISFIIMAAYIHTASYLNPYIGIAVQQSGPYGEWVVIQASQNGGGTLRNIREGDKIISIGSEEQARLSKEPNGYRIERTDELVVERPGMGSGSAILSGQPPGRQQYRACARYGAAAAGHQLVRHKDTAGFAHNAEIRSV